MVVYAAGGETGIEEEAKDVGLGALYGPLNKV